MLDIVLVLEWVRDNIANFGGDPGNVTIYGESGGGAKTSMLLAMPPAKGLFHKAIIQSGPGIRAVPRERATLLAKALLDEIGIADAKTLQSRRWRGDRKGGGRRARQTGGERRHHGAQRFVRALHRRRRAQRPSVGSRRAGPIQGRAHHDRHEQG